MRKNILIILLLSLAITSCGKVIISRNYYVLDYNPVLENQAFALTKPFPFSIEVVESRMPRTYDRSQMVIRYSAHKLDYSAENIWAVRLSSAVPDLINNHINKYGLFDRCQREYLDSRPDYEIVTYLNRIELIQNKLYKAVHLSIDYYLRQSDDRNFAVKYSADREIEIPQTADMDIFAKTVSDILKEETDNFLLKAVDYFKNLKRPSRLSEIPPEKEKK